MKRTLIGLLAAALCVALVGSAEARTVPKPSATKALSAAQVRSQIQSGALKPLTAKQAAQFRSYRSKTARSGRKTARSGRLAARAATAGNYYIGSYKYAGDSFASLWYDLRYSFYYTSSSYYYYVYYANWKVCFGASYTDCVYVNRYSILSYVYYSGTWYTYGWYGPYTG